MKYDVIKSTNQLMGIWGLGNIKQGEETKMTVSTDNDEANNRDEAQPCLPTMESAGSARWEQLAKYASVAELGAINANVMEYMRHWERRAETAEKLARDLAACGDPKPWKKDKWAWAKSQLHPSDDPNHVHPYDCGYTVTGHIHNCDCKPNAPLERRREE